MFQDNYVKLGGAILGTTSENLKKTTTVSGQNAKNVKLYKYSEQLELLEEILQEREPRSNIGDILTNQDLTCDDDVNESVLHENEENNENAQHYTTEVNNPVTGQSQSHTSSN